MPGTPTELAESSTSEQTIMSVAGHVSAKMLAHYSHVRLEATETEGYATIDVTKELPDGESEVQIC